MRLAQILVLLFPLAALSLADPPEKDEVGLRVARMGSDDPAEREEAMDELDRPLAVTRSRLEAELESSEDPEIRLRLRILIGRRKTARWMTDIHDALALAAETKTPLLVVYWDAERDDDSIGLLFRSTTLANEALNEFINDNFLVYWSSSLSEGKSINRRCASSWDGADAQFLRIYFCTADGKIRHGLEGYWSAEVFRAEAERAVRYVHADTDDQAREIRNRIRSAFHEEIAALSAEHLAEHAATRVLDDNYFQSEALLGQPVARILADREELRRRNGNSPFLRDRR